MTVTRSSDFDYFRTVMARPAMRRLAAGGALVDDATLERALRQPDASYYEVAEGPTRLGFIVFRNVAPMIAELHTCLLTLGRRTREAVRLAIAAVSREGARLIVAAYPAVNRAADRLVTDLGFIDRPELAAFYPEDLRASYKFKELSCPG